MIGLLLATLLFVGMYGIQEAGREEIVEVPGNTIDRDINNMGLTLDDEREINTTLSEISLSKDEVDTINSRFQNSTVGGETLFPFVSEALESGKLLLNSVSLFETVSVVIGKILGIDGEITQVFIAILTLTVILSIILIVAGRATQ